MRDRRRVRIKSGFAYALATLVPAAYCVYTSASALELALAVALASVISAAALGYGFGAWYLPVSEERPRFELVAIPLLVCLLAPLIGASASLIFGALAAQVSSQDGFFWVAPMAIAMTMVYFTVSWPVVLGSFVTAGVVMALVTRREPN